MRQLVHTEYGAVDDSTGELFFYEKIKPEYETLTYEQVEQSRHFYESRDVEELFDIVKRYGERRYSNVVYNLNRERLGKLYLPILSLCSKVDYFNVGFHDRSFLCSVFEVSDKNLNKTLNKIAGMGLFRYSGKGLSKKQQIRIIWNPLSVWKGWENSTTKVMCIQEWYKGLFGSMDVDVSVSPNVKPLVFEEPVITKSPPDPYVSPFYSVDGKERFKLLMDVSDAEFELIWLNVKRDAFGNVIPIQYRGEYPSKCILLKEDFLP